MQATTTRKLRPDFGGASLLDEIADFQSEFVQMRGSLVDARLKIAELKRELAESKLNLRLPPEVDLRSLRRHVAFGCHPDRGGDTRIMQQLNQLFDLLGAIP